MPAIDVRHPGLPHLFDPAAPNAPILFGILEGRTVGRAVADDPHDPRVAAVQDAQGIAFISRTASQAAFDSALADLRREAVVGLVWPDAAIGPVVPEASANVMERLGFDPIGASDDAFEALRARLPSGVTVRPIDAGLIARCEWREQVTGAYGSAEAFVEHGVGLCLMRDDEILAEAYAPFIGRGVAEIGTVTAEAHRGQGLATIAIAWLAVPLADRGLSMYWSCDASNAPSIRVAEKLGFGSPRPYRILLYRRNEG